MGEDSAEEVDGYIKKYYANYVWDRDQRRRFRRQVFANKFERSVGRSISECHFIKKLIKYLEHDQDSDSDCDC